MQAHGPAEVVQMSIRVPAYRFDWEIADIEHVTATSQDETKTEFEICGFTDLKDLVSSALHYLFEFTNKYNEH